MTGSELFKRKLWLLKLVPDIPYGKLLTGTTLFLLLMSFFHLGVDSRSNDTTPAIFFSLIIAYIIPAFSFITEKSQQALRDLRPSLDLDDEEIDRANKELESASFRAVALQLAGGMFMAASHLTFVRGSLSTAINETVVNTEGIITTSGTMLVWMVMTTVISMLIKQAMLFANLGAQHVRISLLTPRRLLPFARVAISSSLAVIGALALFPLMSIESGVNLAESLPGAIATLVPLIVMFIIPVWPVHKRLVQMKEQEMANMDAQIEARAGDESGASAQPNIVEEITPLLNYRREISEVSTWPFDAGVVTRLSFYLVIPPLTWAGAALIENLDDSVI